MGKKKQRETSSRPPRVVVTELRSTAANHDFRASGGGPCSKSSGMGVMFAKQKKKTAVTKSETADALLFFFLAPHENVRCMR